MAIASASHSKTFVYVSYAEDGEIGIFSMQPDGRLEAAGRASLAKLVGPLALSPDNRVLYAAVRSKPYAVHSFEIDRGSGALKPIAVSPLAESFPYISLDRTGRHLFGASYGGNLVTVNAIDEAGRVSPEPLQNFTVGRNAHAIRIDGTNRFVFVPALGTDQIFQFRFDASTGRLSSNTPPAALAPAGTGPRHLIFSPDNRFLYVLSEFLGTVTTWRLDQESGLLSEVGTVESVPAASGLSPGAARLPVGTPGATARDTSNDVWAADIRATGDGRFVYTTERTRSTISAFRADAANGALTYVGTVSTARQPRGIAVSPSGRFLVASGELSPTLSVYAIDSATGALSPIQECPAGKGANWVQIVELD